MMKNKSNIRINKVSFIYNGNTKAFDEFMKSMINSYLNSDTISKREHREIVRKVEILIDSA